MAALVGLSTYLPGEATHGGIALRLPKFIKSFLGTKIKDFITAAQNRNFHKKGCVPGFISFSKNSAISWIA